jgi:hypothetical protein
VPLKPKKHLTINIGGVKENDFAMILGYPGRTNRWMPAGGIEQNVKFSYPAWVEGSKTGMDNMKKYMTQSDAFNLIYASKYAGVANYWKNRQGMIDALTKFGTAKSKAEQEAKFNNWANKPANKAKYGNVVEKINKYYSLTNEKARHDNYLQQLLRTSAFGFVSRGFGAQLMGYVNADAAAKEKMRPTIEKEIKSFFEEMHLPAEKDILKAQLTLYSSKSKGYSLAPSVIKIYNNFDNFVNSVFTISIFTSEERLMAFLNLPSKGLLTNDPIYFLSSDLITHLASKSDTITKAQNEFLASYRLLVEGLRESKLATIQYPDANSTLRLTYGKVRALPADKRNDAKVNYYTTMESLVKKYKAGDNEFDLPARLLELYKKKDFGKYADAKGYMPVCFLTDNDITGGNSGSPVLNGKGQLIGLAFDGNIEAMAGDVIFDKKLQRTINVDVRYVLWVIEKFANSKHIVDEMDIVNN